MKKRNRELFDRAFNRFVRVGLAGLLSLVITELISALPQLELEPSVRLTISLVVIPGLVGLDKYFRDKGVY